MHHDWKKNKIRKKQNARNSTPGTSKGGRCQASAEQRYMAKSSRSYKSPNYQTWRNEMDKLNGKRRSRN